MEKEMKARQKNSKQQGCNGGFGDSPFDWCGGGKIMAPPPYQATASSAKDRTFDKTFGKLPQESPDPYAYLKANNHGYEMGAGLLNYQWDNGNHSATAASIDLKDGVWDDEDGGRRFGRQGYATLFEGYAGKNELAGIGGTFLKANYDASLNPNKGLKVGVGATIASAQGHLGKFSDTSHNDTQIRGGFGAGVGFGVGLNWGDSDGDGYREYGFDLDIAALKGFSIGLSTEDPLALIPGNYTMPGRNQTEDAINYAKKAGKWASAAGKKGIDATKRGAEWAWDQTKAAGQTTSAMASRAYDGAKGVVKAAPNWIANKGAQLGSAAISGGNYLIDQGSSIAKDIYSGSKKAIGSAWESTSDYLQWMFGSPTDKSQQKGKQPPKQK